MKKLTVTATLAVLVLGASGAMADGPQLSGFIDTGMGGSLDGIADARLERRRGRRVAASARGTFPSYHPCVP